ncbi:MAG: hypothetical protein JXA25_12720 [Anaerolineales bacterium]|nr:hypothetical protein [Anaerolineales bacterium]
MLSRISTHLHSWAKGWAILSVIVVFIVLINLPHADPALVSMSLDGQMSYTPEEAFSSVASYGDDGRTQIIWIHLADFILITLYTAIFYLSISWLLQRGFIIPDSRLQRLNLVPILGDFLRWYGKHMDYGHNPGLSCSAYGCSLTCFNLHDVQVHHG